MNSNFIPINIAILTISDTRNLETDTSGALLQEKVQTAGHSVSEREIVTDNIYAIRAIVSNWVNSPNIDAILTTGGTGLTGRDGTPEAVSVLFDKYIDGFGELFRSISYQEIGTSTVQSRAIAGIANGTFVFSLPGSSGACRTAWDKILQSQLDARHKPCNFIDLIPRLLEK